MVESEAIPHSDIVFSREGAGDRAIVFQHGFLDDQYVWNPVIAELTASQYEIVRLDLAGFGGRAGANGPFTYDRFAADLAAVVDALDKPFVLVGHSMAGPIVELVAAERHDRTLGLVLLTPIPMAGAGTPDEAFEMFRSLGEIGPEHLRGFRQQTAPLASEAELDRLVAVAGGLRPEVVRTVADVWNNGHPAGARPSGFSGPVLVLPGSEDILVTPEVVASSVVARFPSAKVEVSVIDKAGHWPHIEQPSAVAAAINGFLAELTP